MQTKRWNIDRQTLVIWCLSYLMMMGCHRSALLPPGDPDHGGITLPEGFTALVVVDSIGPARHLAVKDNGDIYMKLRYSPDDQGGNVALRDKDGDGKADVVQYFGDYRDQGVLANGMTIHEDYLYFSSALEVYRQKLDSALIPNAPAERVLFDNHSHGTHWHITKPVAFDDSGHMFVPFGAPSNACMDVEGTPAGIPGLPGIDPCPDLVEHGGIWQFDMGRTNLTPADGKRFATGIRSVVAMDWNPRDQQLYVVMHGRDDLNMLFPNLYSPWESAVLPAEEFMKVTEGADFGWPYCYYDQIRKEKVLAPEYGGNGSTIGRCEDCDDPLMGFPGHWAPNDLLFYKGDQFPKRYKEGAFIAFHGSTNRAPYPQAGYFVAFVPFSQGLPTGEWEVFADGFAGVDLIVNVSDAVYRPMGLATGPDGSLYITDSNQGKIWRIMYKGDPSEFQEQQLSTMKSHRELSHIRTPDSDLDNLQKEAMSDGQRLYQDYCVSCHQANGEGTGARFPSLANSSWVTSDPQLLIATVRQGLQGKIEVNGKNFNGIMPAFDFLSAEETATLLTYIRQSFGNNAESISIDEVNDFMTKNP